MVFSSNLVILFSKTKIIKNKVKLTQKAFILFLAKINFFLNLFLHYILYGKYVFAA